IAWQQMFSLQQELYIPVEHPDLDINQGFTPPSDSDGLSYGGRLMQGLGIQLWQWLFQGSIRDSLVQSRGLSLGQKKPLRLRLDIRDPKLIPLPWEIMQSQPGKQSIGLNENLLFSRTSRDVDPLSTHHAQDHLNILLVLGESTHPSVQGTLQLQQEADSLLTAIQENTETSNIERSNYPVDTKVDTLIQPTPAELNEALENNNYNVFFYAGHGIPAPDGGLLYLHSDAKINGTELAQVLVREQVTLAVFNACWGAQPDRVQKTSLPRSSLAEVLIHHGVPAVLGMRDAIADQEALSFIQAFTEALSERMPVDRAVAIARQQLLTLYKFNQPAWTLPILYMHPQFNGELVRSLGEGITELPTVLPSDGGTPVPTALIRFVDDQKRVWNLHGGMIRVGRRSDNDLVIRERWVSQSHAEIFYRETTAGSQNPSSYFLRDNSRFGTLIFSGVGWEKIHRQEISLQSGMRIKFGSSQGQALEFILEVED
ncbi:MAG: CHAT domain-containing protein, partial [Kamptonema sp. SIO4C4]|nr:CHAT domain-containing protein [Kamptonema sp. SIO4C4]